MGKKTHKKDPFWGYSSSEEEHEHGDDCRNFCSPQNSNNFSTFLRESSIHGIKYIGQLDACLGARIFWVGMFLIGVGTSIYWIMTGVVADLLENPVIISFQESEITIDQIPFPAVTICSSSKRKTEVYLKQFWEFGILAVVINTTNVTQDTFHDYIRRYNSLNYLSELCQDSNGFSDHFKTHEFVKGLEEIQIKDNAELEFVMEYAKEALHNCEDIVLLCLWASQPFECATEWVPIITEYGNCCTFNMIPEFILRKNYPHQRRQNRSRTNFSRNRRRRYANKIQAWSDWTIDKHLIERDGDDHSEHNHSNTIDIPKHQRSAGLSSGLSILISPDFDVNLYEQAGLPCNSLDGFGFRVHVHSPIQYPHISDFGKAIETGSETFIDITTAITMPDPELEDINKEQRQCYFNGEYNLSSFKDYTQQNCVDECIMNQVYKMCNCVRIYMPRQSQRLCMTQLESVCSKNASARIMEDGAMDLCSHCWPSCTQLEYFAATTELPLRDDVDIWKGSATRRVSNNETKKFPKDVAIVHLFFSKDNVESRSRKSLYGAIQILASAGGVIGLTLGISMISFVEPIYFLMIRRLFVGKSSHQSNPTESTRRKTKERTQNKISHLKPNQIFVQPIHKKENDAKKFVVNGIPRAWIQN